MKLDIQMFSSPYVAFEDLPSTDTPIDSTNLNKIQTDCRDEIGDLTLLETTDKSDLVSAINENKRNIDEGGGGGGIVALKSITTEPSTFDTGDKYYDAEDDLIYTATSSSTWNEGEEPKVTSLYLNEADNNLYRYYNNTMHLEKGGDTLPIGTILPFSGSTIPNNYLLADGSAVSRTTYSELFAIIGTTYGTGDGSTTFNLPNLKGRVPVGLDSNDTDFDILGETGGEKTHTLTTNEMPSHSHRLPISGTAGSDDYLIHSYATANRVLLGETGAAGGGQPHNNLQPYIVQNYIIKVKMGSSLEGQVTDMYSESTTDAYSCNYVNKAFGGTILYNNNSGTTGTIQLNDSADNYDYIDIFYKNNNGYHSSVRIYQPNNKNVALSTIAPYSPQNQIWLQAAIKRISGTSITNVDNAHYAEGEVYNKTGYGANDVLAILKVVGYKTGLFS